MHARSDTAERILAKSEELFEQFGPIKTTIADIARALQMSPANVYKHFACKSAIIEVVGDRHMTALMARLERMATGRKPAWDRLSAIVVEVARHFVARLANERDIIQLHTMAAACQWKFIDKFDRFMTATLTGLIREGVRSGELICDEPNAAARVLMDCLPAALDPMMVHRTKDADRERRIRLQLKLLRKAFQ